MIRIITSNRSWVLLIAIALGTSTLLVSLVPTQAADMSELLADVRSLTTTMRRLSGDVILAKPKKPITKTVSLLYSDIIDNAANRYWIPSSLIAAVIQCESNWQKEAVSPMGARGLMQILPRTAMGEFGIARADLFDPVVNINVGTAYLRRLANRYDGDTATTVAAYNAGPGRIDSGRRSPRETREFKRCVHHWFGTYNRNGK